MLKLSAFCPVGPFLTLEISTSRAGWRRPPPGLVARGSPLLVHAARARLVSSLRGVAGRAGHWLAVRVIAQCAVTAAGGGDVDCGP